MSHTRELIRDAIVAMLSTPVLAVYPTSAGANVYANRATRAWREELPMILVFTKSESSVPRGINTHQYIRTLNVQIEIYAEANDSLDDTLDDICLEVENLIESDVSLGGYANTATLTDTEFVLDAEGEKLLGKATLSFEVKYID